MWYYYIIKRWRNKGQSLFNGYGVLGNEYGRISLYNQIPFIAVSLMPQGYDGIHFGSVYGWI